MSYLFVAYLYDTRRFNAQAVIDYWTDTEPSFIGERLVRVSVSPRVEAIFYTTGDFGIKSRGFFVACETLLLDGYAEGPALLLKSRGEKDFQYAVWASADVNNFDVSMLFTDLEMQGRAIVQSQGERILKRGDVVEEYERAALDFTPRALGLVDEKTGLFSEEAFERLVAEREELFRPDLLVRDEIGPPRGKVLDAFHHAFAGQGEVMWPPPGLEATLVPSGYFQENPTIPVPPIWGWIAGQAPASSRPQSKLKRKRKNTT